MDIKQQLAKSQQIKNLRRHKQLVGKRIVPCPRCGQGVCQKNLQKHLRTHTNHRRYAQRDYRGHKKPTGIRNHIQYPPEFNAALKERIRERDGRCCKWCGKSEADNGKRLSIHHVSGNHLDCSDANLAALCRYCHDVVAHRGKYARPENLTKEEFEEKLLEHAAARMGL